MDTIIYFPPTLTYKWKPKGLNYFQSRLFLYMLLLNKLHAWWGGFRETNYMHDGVVLGNLSQAIPNPPPTPITKVIWMTVNARECLATGQERDMQRAFPDPSVCDNQR